jgi:hypothetical protein
MNLIDFVRSTQLTDNAEIALAYNKLLTRYAPARLTLLELGRALVASGLTSEEAEALSDRLMLDVQATAATKPSRLAVLAPLTQGGSVDFADPMVRDRLPAVVESPGPFTAQDFQAVAGLLTDTYGGDKTADDVATAKAEVAAAKAVVAANAARETLRGVIQTRLNTADAKIDSGDITDLAGWVAEVSK